VIADPLTRLSACAAVEAMRRGDITAERYAQALLQQAARLGQLNAFRTLDSDKVLEAARERDRERAAGRPCSALHGLPLPVKDSINTADLPTSNGTRALRDFRPARNAAVLEPLLAQGAILMGKTNLHELSRGYTGNNGAFGAVRNPHRPDHVPGGSSGGSGAVVAARIAPLALAEDTLGSIRVPASMCGITGLRPTYGRYPDAGVMSLTLDKFDQVGPLARSVEDLILFDSIVTGDHECVSARELSSVRLGIVDALLDAVDAEVGHVVSDALQRLHAAGIELVHVSLPDVHQALAVASIIIGYENMLSMSRFLREQQTGLTFEELLAQVSPNIRALYRTAAPSHEVYETALRQRESLRSEVQQCFAAHRIEALVFPPILVPPPLLGDNMEVSVNGQPVSIRQAMGRNTALGSVACLASLVLPAGLTTQGLPVGLEFAAPAGADRAVLSLGLSLQHALPVIPTPTMAS